MPRAKLTHDADGRPRLSYLCPGCLDSHTVPVGPGGWDWNGDLERPTLRPSVLARSGHHAPHHLPGDRCWCDHRRECREAGEDPGPFECSTCHSFVTDGRAELLGDSSHPHAGQVLDLQEWPRPASP